MKNKEQAQINNPQPRAANGKNIGMAVVAYIFFFVPLLTGAKNDPFVKFHVKQGLVVFIAGCAFAVVSWIPVIGLFAWILNIALLVFIVVGIMNAVNGREKPLPYIGKFAENFKF